jgi:hypothetical protein
MNMRLFAALLGGMVVASSFASADDWRDRDHDHDRHEGARGPEAREREWHEREWRERDWRHGRWERGLHDGRNGWWWVVGDLWYFYPRRVAVVPAPPVVVAGPPGVVYSAPPGSVYYYCARPRGYYPAIPDCPGGWQIVREQ